MTPGYTTDVGESTRESPSTRGKSAPETDTVQCVTDRPSWYRRAIFTFEPLNRALSTGPLDVEVST